METTRFDQMTQILSRGAPRRGLLRGIGLALGIAAFRFTDETEARKRKRKRKKRRKNTPLAPLVFNDYGCIDVGQACRGDDTNCCSGICDGGSPKTGEADTSRCVAHNALTCQDGQDSCTQGNIPCGTNGLCVQTTGKGAFCGVAGPCAACQRDQDCEAMTGPGSACIVCASCVNSSGGTACKWAALPA